MTQDMAVKTLVLFNDMECTAKLTIPIQKHVKYSKKSLGF